MGVYFVILKIVLKLIFGNSLFTGNVDNTWLSYEIGEDHGRN